jgi:hypothetical protein
MSWANCQIIQGQRRWCSWRWDNSQRHQGGAYHFIKPCFNSNYCSPKQRRC